ncbi:uncharacterized protein LOC111051924 [Nilaparvata lugens]|uniref:uncharacterized protein LOC111051924 n=1 Tax=Nilaparvata lugens TaxID=108931 RepID=UPI00193D8E94|nr:uncharacterized protein LOC111051924 [Nilaparvata lugens]XP_039291814.1 uncharacterized protein LOC111051924 [Nilaparvata lugens]XP_039291815.1 uncharacterized protein LOC111051924 [Nilaparvata lugens]
MEEEYQSTSDAENADFTTDDTDNEEDVISNADKSTTAMDGKDRVSKSKTKRKKRKMRRRGGKNGKKAKMADDDEEGACPNGYCPCPHLHFKANVIEREVLTREQHMMLLSTPRGYRWEPDRAARYCTKRSRRKRVGCSGDADAKNASKSDRRCIKPAEKHIGPDDQRYVGRFLGEVWNYLPPDMVDNLKKLLVEEFGMSEQ